MAGQHSENSDLSRFGYQQQLRRELRVRDLLAYGLVFMVVIAPFGVFGGVFQAADGMIALAYLVGALAMMLTVSSYGIMIEKYPLAGSVYAYTGRAIHPAVGFLTGWAILLDYVAIPLLLSIVAGAAMAGIVTSVPAWAWVIIFVVANTIMNIFGIKTTKLLNWLFLGAEMVILVIFLGYGVKALSDGKGRGWSMDPLYHHTHFTWTLVLGGVSIAVLSFLGFDALALLAEDARDGSRTVTKAMMGSLALVTVLFIAQTWVAALLVPNPDDIIKNGDAAGDTFYQAAQVAVNGHWGYVLTAASTALAWGIANNMVAQVATSRLLMAMSRDGALPSFLSRVWKSRSVPGNAILTTAVVSLVLGVWQSRRATGIADMSSLVNFGAMIAFIMLHVSVVWSWIRNGRRGNVLRNLIIPIVGAAILVAVIWQMKILAQWTGAIWLIIGLLVLIGLTLAGKAPKLSEGDPTAEPAPYEETEVAARG